MAKYYKPTSDVIDLVESVMKRYHEHLEDAEIGILFRDEAPKSGSHVTFAQAKRVKDDDRAAGLPYDFIIWFAEDQWDRLTDAQREALVDHELCHLDMKEKDGILRPVMLDHDITEFNCIIERHGLWWPGAEVTREAIRAHTMPLFGPRGKVQAVEVNGDVVRALGESATHE